MGLYFSDPLNIITQQCFNSKCFPHEMTETNNNSRAWTELSTLLLSESSEGEHTPPAPLPACKRVHGKDCSSYTKN